MLMAITAAIVVAVDLLTKMWATQALGSVPGGRVPVIAGLFDFYLAHNTGAAFSFLASHPGVITAISVVVVVIILVWSRTLPHDAVWARFAMGLFIGGGLGNITDRIRFGYVVDFLHVYYREWYWPTFNVADSAITIGIVVLVYVMLFTKEFEASRTPAGTPPSEDGSPAQCAAAESKD